MATDLPPISSADLPAKRNRAGLPRPRGCRPAHGAKVAAERRFRHKYGPRVPVCTAAGREGINLQFARVLLNFDLPWKPMDMEQRKRGCYTARVRCPPRGYAQCSIRGGKDP
jgi:Helicase conserved C-terminal domain